MPIGAVRPFIAAFQDRDDWFLMKIGHGELREQERGIDHTRTKTRTVFIAFRKKLYTALKAL